MSIKYKEPVLEVIEELKCFFGDATDGLDACYREYRMFPGQTAHAACLPRHLFGRRRMHWPEQDIGNLRVALNVLVRLFRL